MQRCKDYSWSNLSSPFSTPQNSSMHIDTVMAVDFVRRAAERIVRRTAAAWVLPVSAEAGLLRITGLPSPIG